MSTQTVTTNHSADLMPIMVVVSRTREGQCHTPGRICPFSLDSAPRLFEQVEEWLHTA